MPRKFAPMVVFGARGKPSKTAVGYVEKGGHVAHAHICELKKDHKYSMGEPIPREDVLNAIDGEYVHLYFCKKESLYWFIRSLQELYDKWEDCE